MNHRPHLAIVPAAGRATRHAPASLAVPKELMPIGGVPAIHRVLEAAADSGIRKAAIVIAPEKRHLRTYLEDAPHPRLDDLRERMEFVFSVQAEPTGIIDALLLGWQTLGTPPLVATLMPDCLRIGGTPPLDELVDALRQGSYRAEKDYISVGHLQAPCPELGDENRTAYRLDNTPGPLRTICNHGPDVDGFVGAGTSVVTRSYLKELQTDLHRGIHVDSQVISRIVRSGRLLGLVHTGSHVYDIGNPRGLAAANAGWLKARPLHD